MQNRCLPATLAAGAVAGLLVLGCASPGNPRPPSLHLPDKVTDLTASRIGDRVKIFWTPPTRTTDRIDINFPVTVEICRDVVVPPPAVKPAKPPQGSPCTVVQRLAGHPGPSNTEDVLPPGLLGDTRVAIAYRIRLLNPAGRSADPAAPVFVASGPAQPAVAAFRATQTRSGVVLEWAAPPAGTVVEVTRTLVVPPGGAVTGPHVKKENKGLPGGKKVNPAAPVLLRPATEANGMIDLAPQMTETYAYTAQSIANVELAGHALQLKSEPTPPVMVARRDTFPPAPPRGLVSVPGTLNGKETIDLSWDPNTEPDLAGYRVYRVDLADTSALRRLLTPQPLPGPAFRDATVLPNHRYRYQITAIDQSGNESAPGASIEDGP